VRDQGACGSCWAFGATESLADRFCIATNGTVNVVLSVEQLISCDLDGLEGCRGGEAISAFTYTSIEGLPSESCYPYLAEVNNCRAVCVNGSHADHNVKISKSMQKKEDWVLYYSQLDSIRWHFEEEAIQAAIFEDGPVEACFEVYADFLSYKSGVYVYQEGDYEGGHCIKLIGWGKQSGTSGLEYWIAQNSWGSDWGMNGFFLIERGVDMCHIEREVFSVLPNI